MLTIVVLAAMLAVLLFAEYLTINKNLHSEVSRKFVHITVGTFAAFWPFFLSWNQIRVLSIVALVGMIVSLKLNIFKSIHGVTRDTYGEILSVAAVGILSFIAPDPWIFAAAMLHLALADGLAAVVGVRFGKTNNYSVFGMKKSVAGTATFFVISLIIVSVYIGLQGDGDSNLVARLFLPVIATLAENLSGRGFDNLTIPLLVALVLINPLA